jgi:hypothetical protein
MISFKSASKISIPAVLLLAAGASTMMFSQSEPPPVGVPSPGWLAWSMNLDETTPPRRSGLDQTEFAAVLQNIQRIGAVFRRMPYFNPPAGIEIVPSRNIYHRVGAPHIHRVGIKTGDTSLPQKHPLKDWPPPGRTADPAKGPARADFSLRIYRPEYKRGNPSCSIRIQINDPWLEGRFLFDDASGGMYLPWPSVGEKDGRLRFQADRGTIIEKILPAGREPWIPVSRERWIKTLIARNEETLEKQRLEIIEGAEERRSKIERSYKAMKSFDAEAAEKMRKTFEENEKIHARRAEAIAAEDYDALEAAGDRGSAMVGRNLLALRKELADMSPAERTSPAYGFEGNPQQYWMPRETPRSPSLLLDPEDKNALPVLAPNPEFFRTDISAVEIQSLTIINRLWKEIDEKLQAELDWAALTRLVK